MTKAKRSAPRGSSAGAAVGVVWTIRAKDELRAIGDYIARDDPRAAERWVRRLLRAVEDVSALPSSGRMVPELGRPEIREVLEQNYRIVYRVAESRLEVLTVFEGHMLLRDVDE